MRKSLRLNNRKRGARGRKSFFFALVLLSFVSAVLVYFLKVDLFFLPSPSQQETIPSPAEAALRGTIYDRQLDELAVSYRQYSLYAHPGEIRHRKLVAQALAPVLHHDEETIIKMLRKASGVVELADNLDYLQAREIEQHGFSGLYCKPLEVRFYPYHTSAAHVLGFTGRGIGLAGAEKLFDPILKGSAFYREFADKIDFDKQKDIAGHGADVVLSLDIQVQKLVEQHLQDYLQARGADQGVAVLLDPGTGKIVALTSTPGFDPNYFWQAEERTRENLLYDLRFSRKILTPLLARAAYIEQRGLIGTVLPETIAALDYGLSSPQHDQFDRRIALYAPVVNRWEAGQASSGYQFIVKEEEEGLLLSGAQVAVAVSSLINGGWRISPFVLEGIYDHQVQHLYDRKKSSIRRSHVLDPAIGVKMRRNLFSFLHKDGQGNALYSKTHVRRLQGEDQVYFAQQHLLVGITPAAFPRYLLLMASTRDHLGPLKISEERLAAQEEKHLAAFFTDLQKQNMSSRKVAQHIKAAALRRSEENMRRFFISKQIDLGEEEKKTRVQEAMEMPELTGMSLRKALQRLNYRNLQITVLGSGQIVRQYPVPGTQLKGSEKCVLTLQPPQ